MYVFLNLIDEQFEVIFQLVSSFKHNILCTFSATGFILEEPVLEVLNVSKNDNLVK